MVHCNAALHDVTLPSRHATTLNTRAQRPTCDTPLITKPCLAKEKVRFKVECSQQTSIILAEYPQQQSYTMNITNTVHELQHMI